MLADSKIRSAEVGVESWIYGDFIVVRWLRRLIRILAEFRPVNSMIGQRNVHTITQKIRLPSP